MCIIAALETIAARLAASVVALLVLLPLAAAAQPVPEPDGYRMEAYRAPVPATLKGATVVSTEEAAQFWRAGAAIFIDVLPRPPKPDLPEGTIWQEPPHFGIPGSVWLADVGYGGLSPTMEGWFRDNLERLTLGDKTRRLLIYCRADCWMSWNAARRAVEWGFERVVWYPGGTDDWEAANLPLQERHPAPRPAEP
jgi:PQQ-dependent catabolism-associated CXXCW motif protein